MTRKGQGGRIYDAPLREAAAARTRRTILEAAIQLFEECGWAGTRLAAVAADAGVSPKTIEAVFGTKARLLRGVVDFAIRGDEEATPIAARPVVTEMEATATAGAMLDLHAAQVRRVASRSAGIAWVVEQAAPIDDDVAQLWQTMSSNRRTGARWATRTLLAKPDRDPDVRRRDVETTFWLAIDWSTYRSLTTGHGLTSAGFERWLRTFYARTLLA